MTKNFTPKNAKNFHCNFCDFLCSKKSDFDRHVNTAKHKIRTNTNDFTPKNAAPDYVCDCGKSYKHASSLWNHKKKCILDKNDPPSIVDSTINISTHQITDTQGSDDKNIVIKLLEQNNELQKQVMDLLHNGTQHITNNNHKTFNLNVFLNEKCKNAMNITDFVNSLEFHLSDFEKLGDIGYVNGMSNLIIKNLKDMDITERPVHCTDKKREVLYVKDNNKWDKETQDKPILRKVIKQVAHKNALLLQEFKEKYPDCMKSDSRHADTYNKLIIEAMGGKDYEEEEQEDKIIKRLAKEVSLCTTNDYIDDT